jgi:integrase/recombinase XerC
VQTLLEGVENARDKAILALLVSSGLRLSELCSLDRESIEVQQLDSAGKVIGVGRTIGKGEKEREFLVDLPTLKLVHAYLLERGADGEKALFLSTRKRRIDKRTVQHMLRSWCRRLGLPAFHPHQLRSTFGTRLSRLGVPILEISKLLGHASLATTTEYVKPDQHRIRTEFFAAMEKLNV